MRRWVAALVLSSVLAGCGSGGGASGGAASGAAPAPTTARSEPAPAAPAGSGAAGTAAAPPVIMVPPAKVRASFSVISGGIGPYWVAEEAGLWKQHGLDVELLSIAGTPPSMAALISGETQFAVGSADAVLRVQAQNPDVVSLVSTSVGNTHRFMAVPEIRRPEDLRGKRIGILSIGDGAYSIGSKALLKIGIDPRSDVVWVPMGGGGTGAMVAGLIAGIIDATPLTAPNDVVAARQGAHSVLDVADLNLPAGGLATNTMRRTLEQQRPMVEAYVAGVIDAIRLFKDDPALSKAVLARRTQMDDPEAIDWAWQVYSGQRKAPRIYLDHAEMRLLLDDLLVEYPELAGVQLDRVLDNSVLEGLEAKGYFSSR